MANLNWNQIRADFGDANQAMANTQRGLSQAGTVFGELRKSILDEEQRAFDNAFKEKEFNENVRQFGLQYALDQDKLAEDILHNRNTEGLTARGQDLSYKSSMAGHAISRARLNIEQQRFANEQAYNKRLAEGMAQLNELGKVADTINANKKSIEQYDTQLKDTTLKPEQRATIETQRKELLTQNNALEQEYKNYPTNANERAAWMDSFMLEGGFHGLPKDSGLYKEAEREHQLATAAMERQHEIDKKIQEARQNAINANIKTLQGLEYNSNQDKLATIGIYQRLVEDKDLQNAGVSVQDIFDVVSSNTRTDWMGLGDTVMDSNYNEIKTNILNMLRESDVIKRNEILEAMIAKARNANVPDGAYGGVYKVGGIQY